MERRAQLEKRKGRQGEYLALVASNGEPLMTGEQYAGDADRGREDVLDAMEQVLIDEGRVFSRIGVEDGD